MEYIYRLPLIQKSLPARYAMFVALIGAIMAALWLARDVTKYAYKVGLGVILIALLLPNLRSGAFFTPVSVPTFFSTTMYQRYLKPNDVALILPLGFYRTDMLWQQAADFSFDLPAGYGGFTPPPEDILPIQHLLNTDDVQPFLVKQNNKVVGETYSYQLEQYIATEHVNAIVVQERFISDWSTYLQFLRQQPQHIGGVWYYHVPPAFSQATIPGEQVSGEPVARPYSLVGAAQWNDAAHQLVMPANTPVEALETLPSNFRGGKYAVTLTIHSASSAPIAYAEIVVNGQTTTVSLPNGTTQTSLNVPGKSAPVVIKIISLGGAAFTVGDSSMTKV
jgi:hypothetical protein